MLDLLHIDKTFHHGTANETTLFSDFSLTIARGEFVAVVGSNGSGKTTVLNLISGSLLPDHGQVLLDGEDMTNRPPYRRARRIGRVYQDPALGTVPHMTIRENLALAENKGKPYGLSLCLSRKKNAYYRELVAELGLGLEEKMDIPVSLLSGGQRQALSLLMSTLTPVDLLLLDEHTAALDPKTADRVMALTERIVREKGITTLMVTHNLRYAVEYGDRICMFHAGKILLDRGGEEKKATRVDDLLSLFQSISIECGN
ncbi:MAG: ATP-binding cassette domain-containing protein [Clostridia bacterium]|nr:ATP-binding cassette domain-containing protein [Clostridia bacterium]